LGAVFGFAKRHVHPAVLSFAASGTFVYPVATGKAAILRPIAPNSRRFR
jgi:hypothetical protein